MWTILLSLACSHPPCPHLLLALIILLTSSAHSSSCNIVDTGHILFLWFKATALCYCHAVHARGNRG
ncbi:hypothetical protein M405DRAFT_830961 [Rhizopogon salebrosus TDB-379]|nr:hypothetical protein M405DRAFT_830961 [Rhizopogon salebrosus TDB-379]